MMLVDANLLLYAKISSYSQHGASKLWLEQQLNVKHQHVGLPWASLLAFIRIATHRKLFEHPLTVEQAWRQVEQWLAMPSVWIPSPSQQHALYLGQLLTTEMIGNLIPDAHLAALALEHDVQLCSADNDFSHFAGLRWHNPLKT